MLPALERQHDVLAPTLAGHAGGPPLDGDGHRATLLADAVERAMDEAGFETAHVAGNSLGGYVALQLAARGRARSVVALAPAGGWAPGDDSFRETLDYFSRCRSCCEAAAPHADAIVATPRAGAARPSSSPTQLRAHPGGAARPPDARRRRLRRPSAADRARARRAGRSTPSGSTAPCGSSGAPTDRLLPWPRAAARYRDDWLPHADWVELDGVGHCPQLDVPLEAAQLILGFTR